MAIKMRVSSPRVSMTIGSSAVNMSVGAARLVYLTGEPYEGEYEVTPSTDEAQTLHTAQKLLTKDVTVHKIPYYEMDNESGGITIYIGSDEELVIE